MLVSVAGPLTHIPMVGIWLGLLAAATHANTGAVGVSLSPLPYPDTTSAFFQALCASAVLVRMPLTSPGAYIIARLPALGVKSDCSPTIFYIALSTGVCFYGAVTVRSHSGNKGLSLNRCLRFDIGSLMVSMEAMLLTVF
jgi:hypothetical protein